MLTSCEYNSQEFFTHRLVIVQCWMNSTELVWLYSRATELFQPARPGRGLGDHETRVRQMHRPTGLLMPEVPEWVKPIGNRTPCSSWWCSRADIERSDLQYRHAHKSRASASAASYWFLGHVDSCAVPRQQFCCYLLFAHMNASYHSFAHCNIHAKCRIYSTLGISID